VFFSALSHWISSFFFLTHVARLFFDGRRLVSPLFRTRRNQFTRHFFAYRSPGFFFALTYAEAFHTAFPCNGRWTAWSVLPPFPGFSVRSCYCVLRPPLQVSISSMSVSALQARSVRLFVAPRGPVPAPVKSLSLSPFFGVLDILVIPRVCLGHLHLVTLGPSPPLSVVRSLLIAFA